MERVRERWSMIGREEDGQTMGLPDSCWNVEFSPKGSIRQDTGPCASLLGCDIACLWRNGRRFPIWKPTCTRLLYEGSLREQCLSSTLSSSLRRPSRGSRKQTTFVTVITSTVNPLLPHCILLPPLHPSPRALPFPPPSPSHLLPFLLSPSSSCPCLLLPSRGSHFLSS